MRTKISAFSVAAVTCLLMVMLVSACKKDPCETAICQPCPSSRIVFQYQDSTGQCFHSLHTTARIYALHSRTLDTLYAYTFSDSCHVSFLIADSVVYHLENASSPVRCWRQDHPARLGKDTSATSPAAAISIRGRKLLSTWQLKELISR